MYDLFESDFVENCLHGFYIGLFIDCIIWGFY